MKTIYKLLIVFVAYALLLFFGGMLLLLLLFAGEYVYAVSWLVAGIALLILIPVTVSGVVKSVYLRRAWIALGVVVVAVVAGREGVRAWHASFEKFDRTKVDLSLYDPFREGTLAVPLDSLPTLRLTDSLPRLDGATAFYPVYSSFVKALYPQDDLSPGHRDLECRTTRWAYDFFIRKDYRSPDIIFVLRPSEDQMRHAKYSDTRWVFTPIGLEAFVFFVNADNPVTDLSLDQIRGIYSGRITRWSEVGGANRRIRAFQRDEGSGSQTALVDMMGEQKLMDAPTRNVVHGMGPIIDRAAGYANYPGAIGFTFRYYAQSMVGNGNIKLLSVDGVYPSFETIRDGSYPLVSEFYAVWREDTENPNVEPLVEWIRSPQGQQIIEKTGYVPVGGDYPMRVVYEFEEEYDW